MTARARKMPPTKNSQPTKISIATVEM